jgi:hypothetical protein
LAFIDSEERLSEHRIATLSLKGWVKTHLSLEGAFSPPPSAVMTEIPITMIAQIRPGNTPLMIYSAFLYYSTLCRFLKKSYQTSFFS